MSQPTLPQDTGWHGDRRRGASLGRVDRAPPDPHATIRFYLRRIRLDAGGYDPGGAYWGIGAPLYWASSEDSQTEFFFRARNRAAARSEVAARHPGARFFR